MNISDHDGNIIGSMEDGPQAESRNVNNISPTARDDQVTKTISTIDATERNEVDKSEGVLTFINNSEVSYMYQDIENVPNWFAERFGNNIRRLDLSHNRLRDLSGIEKYSSSIQELILDDNEITDDVNFPTLANLQTLFLNKNKITDIESLCTKLAESYPSLTYLSLIGNPACWTEIGNSNKDIDPHDYNRYRLLVLHHLPKLKFLDWETVGERERENARVMGRNFKVARPVRPNGVGDVGSVGDKQTSDEDGIDEVAEDASQFSPLPSTVDQHIGTHTGTFKRNEYQYIGKHSEGNRFITNDSL